MRGETNWHEVVGGIVLQVRRQYRGRNMRSHAACQQRVTIRCRRRDARASERATRTADVLDDQRMAERPPHIFRHDASDNIAGTARGEGHYHSNRSRWVALRLRVRRREMEPKSCNAEQSYQCHSRAHFRILVSCFARILPGAIELASVKIPVAKLRSVEVGM